MWTMRSLRILAVLMIQYLGWTIVTPSMLGRLDVRADVQLRAVKIKHNS